MPPCGVGLKYPVCFVVGSRRLIIQSRLDPPPRIRGISDPSQSRPLLGQAPSLIVYADRKKMTILAIFGGCRCPVIGIRLPHVPVVNLERATWNLFTVGSVLSVASVVSVLAVYSVLISTFSIWQKAQ